MNRKELAQIIADKTSLPFNKANAALGEFLISVREAVKKGEEVRLVGFGTFKLGKRAARIGINPQTKEKMKLPAVKVPKFKAGKSFKKLVN
jgi:DNA-binding protein HU-beta